VMGAVLDAPALLLQPQPLPVTHARRRARTHQPGLMEFAGGAYAAIHAGDLHRAG
jgi:hypothetical protein